MIAPVAAPNAPPPRMPFSVGDKDAHPVIPHPANMIVVNNIRRMAYLHHGPSRNRLYNPAVPLVNADP